MKRLILLFAIIVFCGFGSAFADVTMVQKVQSGAIMGQPPQDTTTTTYVKGKKARTDTKATSVYTIIDMEAGKMYVVDPQKKEVLTMTTDQMKGAGNMLSKLGGQMETKTTVKKTGNSKTINARKCDEYVATTTGPISMTATYCVSTELDYKEFDAFKPFSQDVGKMFGQDAMNQIEGVPVRTEIKMNMLGQNVSSVSELVSISYDPVSESLFEIPKGFSMKEMPKFPGQ